MARLQVAAGSAALVVALLLSGCGDKPPQDMVLIPAGDFVMGSDQVDEDDLALQYGFPDPWYIFEHPAHEVFLPDYYIDKYEVTHARYREFVVATGREAPSSWDGTEYDSGLDNTPVFGVTWFDAQAYCEWAGKRLPSEAEWEKAGRGPHGNLYPWGNEMDPERANLAGRHGGQVTEVGSYESGKSPYGVYDLVGNVTEWTADWYQRYPGNNEKADSAYGKTDRVLRGSSKVNLGHFPPAVIENIMAYYARIPRRDHLNPEQTFQDVGFRCAKSG